MLSVVLLGAVCEANDRSEPSTDHLTRVGRRPRDERPSQHRPGQVRSNRDKTRKAGPATLSVSLVEFAQLSNGKRVTLRDDRGFSSVNHVACRIPWLRRLLLLLPVVKAYVSDPWRFETRASLTRGVLAAVEPDDAELWFDWVVERLHALGVEVNPASVRAAPYRVEFDSSVLQRL